MLGAALLFQTGLLFVGLLAYFVLQPLLTEVPFAGGDFAAIAVMSGTCFVPLGLFLRGVLAQAEARS